MNRWLLKTDPDDYAFDDLVHDKKTVWDGVANNMALQNLRRIKKGDALLIYHTGDEKALIGLAEAASDAYADPNGGDPKLAVIDVRAKRRLPRPVTLAEIKQTPSLKDFDLVRLPRLSVMAVSEAHWQELAKLAGLPD